MKKISVKKILMFSLIALSAIACFVTIKYTPTVVQNIRQANERVEDSRLNMDYESGGLTQASDGFIEIRTADELRTMRNYVNNGTYSYNTKKFRLMANIDIVGDSTWTPIGTYNAPFIGEFDGNGYEIHASRYGGHGDGVSPYDNRKYEYLVGLFGVVGGAGDSDGAAIRNLKVQYEEFNIYFKKFSEWGSTTAAYVGGLVAYAEYGVTIDSCAVYYNPNQQVVVDGWSAKVKIFKDSREYFGCSWAKDGYETEELNYVAFGGVAGTISSSVEISNCLVVLPTSKDGASGSSGGDVFVSAGSRGAKAGAIVGNAGTTEGADEHAKYSNCHDCMVRGVGTGDGYIDFTVVTDPGFFFSGAGYCNGVTGTQCINKDTLITPFKVYMYKDKDKKISVGEYGELTESFGIVNYTTMDSWTFQGTTFNPNEGWVNEYITHWSNYVISYVVSDDLLLDFGECYIERIVEITAPNGVTTKTTTEPQHAGFLWSSYTQEVTRSDGYNVTVEGSYVFSDLEGFPAVQCAKGTVPDKANKWTSYGEAYPVPTVFIPTITFKVKGAIVDGEPNNGAKVQKDGSDLEITIVKGMKWSNIEGKIPTDVSKAQSGYTFKGLGKYNSSSNSITLVNELGGLDSSGYWNGETDIFNYEKSISTYFLYMKWEAAIFEIKFVVDKDEDGDIDYTSNISITGCKGNYDLNPRNPAFAKAMGTELSPGLQGQMINDSVYKTIIGWKHGDDIVNIQYKVGDLEKKTEEWKTVYPDSGATDSDGNGVIEVYVYAICVDGLIVVPHTTEGDALDMVLATSEDGVGTTTIKSIDGTTDYKEGIYGEGYEDTDTIYGWTVTSDLQQLSKATSRITNESYGSKGLFSIYATMSSQIETYGGYAITNIDCTKSCGVVYLYPVVIDMGTNPDPNGPYPSKYPNYPTSTTTKNVKHLNEGDPEVTTSGASLVFMTPKKSGEYGWNSTIKTLSGSNVTSQTNYTTENKGGSGTYNCGTVTVGEGESAAQLAMQRVNENRESYIAEIESSLANTLTDEVEGTISVSLGRGMATESGMANADGEVVYNVSASYSYTYTASVIDNYTFTHTYTFDIPTGTYHHVSQKDQANLFVSIPMDGMPVYEYLAMPSSLRGPGVYTFTYQYTQESSEAQSLSIDGRAYYYADCEYQWYSLTLYYAYGTCEGWTPKETTKGGIYPSVPDTSTMLGSGDGYRGYYHDETNQYISVGGYYGETITLPSATHIKTENDIIYEFIGWKKDTKPTNWNGSKFTILKATDVDYAPGAEFDFGDCYILYAIYQPRFYTIEFDMTWDSGSTDIKYKDISTEGNSITLTFGTYGKYSTKIEDDKHILVLEYTAFDGGMFMMADQVSCFGYTFKCWKMYEDNSGGKIKFLRHNSSQPSYLGIKAGSYGNAKLLADWSVNSYNLEVYEYIGAKTNIAFKSMSVTDSLVYQLGYEYISQPGSEWYEEGIYSYDQEYVSTDVRPAGFEKYSKFVFLGWLMSETIDSTKDSTYVDYMKYVTWYNKTELTTVVENSREIKAEDGGWEDSSRIETKYKDMLLASGTHLKDLSHGARNSQDVPTIKIYGIWLPVYTVTLNAGSGTELQAGAEVYSKESREKNNSLGTSVTFDIDYFTQYKLVDTKDVEVFGYLGSIAEGEYRLHYEGHSIESWQVYVGDDTNQWYSTEGKNPSPGGWEQNAIDVDKDTNIQYLQGDIQLYPKWGTLDITVKFYLAKTDEAPYKSGKTMIESTIRDGTKVSFSTDQPNSSTRDKIYIHNITGYTFLHAYQYVNEVDTSSNNLPLLNTANKLINEMIWSQNNNQEGYYLKDEKWCIDIEGYYVPDLYKVELWPNLPTFIHEDDKGFKLIPNGFDEAPVKSENGGYFYEYTDNKGVHSIELQESIIGDGGGEILEWKVFDCNGTYYIYLRQDQKFDGYTISDVYDLNTGTLKAEKDVVSKIMPTFSINYHDMIGYSFGRTVGNGNVVSYSDIKSNEIKNDWKIEYFDDEDGGEDGKILSAEWRRHIVNFDIKTLLDVNGIGNDYGVGYVLLTEEEQIVSHFGEMVGVGGHEAYTLVIYNGSEYEYYNFSDLSKLKEDLQYNYSESGLSGPENAISMYLGNKVTISAIDQSLDNSMDDFIGYRFIGYVYQTNSGSSTDTRQIDRDDAGYTLVFDLSNEGYAEDNPKITGSFEDGDTIHISAWYNKIKYTMSFAVTDDLGFFYDENGDIINGVYDENGNLIGSSLYDEYYISIGDGKTFNKKSLKNEDIFNKKSLFGDITYNYNGESYTNGAYIEISGITRDDLKSIELIMRVNLGTEYLNWYISGNEIIVDDKTSNSLTNEGLEISIDQLKQSMTYRLNVGFLRTYLHGLDTNNYANAAEQTIDTIQARCNSIPFDINLNIHDISSADNEAEEVVNNIIRAKGSNNKDGTGEADQTQVTLAKKPLNAYTIKFTTKESLEGLDDGWYLLKDGGLVYCVNLDDGVETRYALRSFYLAHSSKSAANQLVTNYAYPTMQINNLPMDLTSHFLAGVVEFSEYIEVASDDRHLDFYLEVSPLVELSFVEGEQEDIIKKGNRLITVEDVTVVENYDENGDGVADGDDLKYYKYLGYIGQKVKIRFTADSTYYAGARLKHSEADIQRIAVNDNIIYDIPAAREFKVELAPKSYNAKGSIVFDNNTYVFAGEVAEGENQIDIDNITQELENPIATASGVLIFVPEFDFGVDSSSSLYYHGNIITLKFKLNSNIADEFDMYVRCNGYNIAYDKKEGYSYTYSRKFVNRDLNFEIHIEYKTDAVKLATNSQNAVAEILAQVNSEEYVYVQTETGAITSDTFMLKNGDKLSVYVRPHVGYKFNNTYTYSEETDVNKAVTTEVVEVEGQEYLKFVLFDSDYGFSLSQIGTYTLNFAEVPIAVNIKNYISTPDLGEDASAGQHSVTSSEDGIITRNSVVTLNKLKDNAGYRFLQYTYIAPLCDTIVGEDTITHATFNFTSTEEQYAEGKYIFNISDSSLMTYLDGLHMANIKSGASYNQLTLVVYANYIKQYNIVYEYANVADKDLVTIAIDDGTNIINECEYRDHGTELNISINANIPKHYKLDIEITNDNEQGTININDETIDASAEVLSRTNNEGLSGVKLAQRLTGNYVILVDVITEKYNTNIIPILWHTVESGEVQEAKIIGPNKETKIDLAQNVCCVVAENQAFEYGTTVTLNIYLAKAKDPAQQYYTILDFDNIDLPDDEDLTQSITLEDHTVNFAFGEDIKESYCYTITYTISEKAIESGMKLSINLTALYWVSLNMQK